MRKIINGKVYDTKTALEICNLSSSGYSRTDFQWESTYLYRSPKGTFFVAGEGGAMSRWAESVGNNGRQGGEGIYLVDEAEARGFCERHGTAAEYLAAFGTPEVG